MWFYTLLLWLSLIPMESSMSRWGSHNFLIGHFRNPGAHIRLLMSQSKNILWKWWQKWSQTLRLDVIMIPKHCVEYSDIYLNHLSQSVSQHFFAPKVRSSVANRNSKFVVATFIKILILGGPDLIQNVMISCGIDFFSTPPVGKQSSSTCSLRTKGRKWSSASTSGAAVRCGESPFFCCHSHIPLLWMCLFNLI